MSFDVNKEVDVIEALAKKRLDTPDDRAAEAEKKLSTEWASLTKQQRQEVGAAIEHKYNSGLLMPVAEAERDDTGAIVGLYFKAAVLDFHKGPATLEVRYKDFPDAIPLFWTKARVQKYDGAKETARDLQWLVEGRLDTPTDKAKEIDQTIMNLWQGLNQYGRDAVGRALEKQYGDDIGSATPAMEKDNRGNCTGINFTASRFDRSAGPHALELTTRVTKEGNRVYASRVQEKKDQPFHDEMFADGSKTAANDDGQKQNRTEIFPARLMQYMNVPVTERD